MTDEERALYEEQEKITQALRPFIQAQPVGDAIIFTNAELEYADQLRQRHREIQKKLDELQRGH